MCQPWWTAETLNPADLVSNARRHHYAAQCIPGFRGYPYGLVIIWSSDHRWVVPVRANGSVCRFDEFEPSCCQWERWQREWQDVAGQWMAWVVSQATQELSPTLSALRAL
jgi:hypothetical protein